MDFSGLSTYLSEEAAKDDFSGIVRIDHAGKTVFEEVHGLASRAWQVPISPQTRFDCASVTKLFTAVATLQQVQAGSFTLDTSAVEYLGLTDTEISPAATVYHLLTHTSGIGDDADEEAGERYEDLFIDKPNYALRQTADCLPNFIHRPANFAPGQGCRYCNVSYVLLGLMVEKVTGSTYREYVKHNIFDRAGMTRAGFFEMDGVEPQVAEGVYPLKGEEGATGWRRNIYSYPPIGSPDGGAHVSAADLIAFHHALVTNKLLGTEQTASMLASKVDEKTEDGSLFRRGFGFAFEYIDGELVSYWKEGINVGASGILQHFPKQDVTLVVLSNLEEGAWGPIEEVFKVVTA
jgi:CubicO group peptidase (beta-lactamase class C family)